MERVSLLRDVLCVPVRDTGHRRFAGGVVKPDGSPVDAARHRRSLTECCQEGLGSAEAYRAVIDGAPKVVEEDGLYIGLSFKHYGHFLIESTGRLWACNEPPYAAMPIYLHSLWGEFEHDGFPGALLRTLGIDPDRIRPIREPLLFRALHVPEQQCGFHRLENAECKPGPDFTAFIEATEQRLNARLRHKSAHEKIYVARSALPFWKGRIVGEKLFEDFLRTRGWHVMYPELMSPDEQLASYVNARQILFAEGSAPHTCLLLPHLSADVAIVARRQNWWGEGPCRIGYMEMKQEVLWVGALEKFYTFGVADHAALSLIDLRAISRDLVAEGFLDAVFEDWPAVGDDALMKDLAGFVAVIQHDPRFLRYLAEVAD